MKPQKKKKTNIHKNKRTPNIDKAAVIKFELLKRQLTQRQIADDLGITPVAVSRAIRDLSISKNVNKWCEENLGIKL